MRINKKRIMNVEAYLSAVPAGAEFRLIADVQSLSEGALERLGFVLPVLDGTSILPQALGPVSRFNADGRWHIRRDLSKEERYIRTVQWSWKQWTGRGDYEEHTDFRDIHRECYPREFVPPPSLELTYTVNDDRELLTSASLTHDAALADLNKHAINLFLELFGYCEIVTSNLTALNPPNVRYANWRLLPPGEHPWDRIEEHIHRVVRARASSTREVIWDRQTTLRSHAPGEIYLGNGGFDDYLAYIFRDKGLVVLESIRKDNAIYIFGLDWEELSRMTKAQIIANNLHLHRIVHTRGWKDRLRQVLAATANRAAQRT